VRGGCVTQPCSVRMGMMKIHYNKLTLVHGCLMLLLSQSVSVSHLPLLEMRRRRIDFLQQHPVYSSGVPKTGVYVCVCVRASTHTHTNTNTHNQTHTHTHTHKLCAITRANTQTNPLTHHTHPHTPTHTHTHNLILLFAFTKPMVISNRNYRATQSNTYLQTNLETSQTSTIPPPHQFPSWCLENSSSSSACVENSSSSHERRFLDADFEGLFAIPRCFMSICFASSCPCVCVCVCVCVSVCVCVCVCVCDKISQCSVCDKISQSTHTHTNTCNRNTRHFCRPSGSKFDRARIHTNAFKIDRL
jgi:hypothetical protein